MTRLPILRAFHNRIWIVALCCVGATILTAGTILRSTRLYAATATLRVESPDAPLGAETDADGPNEDHALRTVLQTIVSRPILERVVEANGLRHYLARPNRSELSKRAAIEALHGMIKVSVRPRTSLIDVRVQSSVPALCAQLADSVAQEYIRYDLGQRNINLVKESKVQLVHAAKVPERPFSPDVKRMFTWGPLAGLAVGIVLVLILSQHEMSVSSGKRTHQARPSLMRGAVRESRPIRDAQDVTARPEKGPAKSTKSFPTLRAAMGLLAEKETRKTVLFTSALAGEGKASCAVKFGLILAGQGLKTVLVDLDLAHPAVDRLLNVRERGQPGMAQVLSGVKRLQDVIYASNKDNVFYIPAGEGEVAGSSTEKLVEGSFGLLLQELLTKFDRVIVNASPLVGCSATLFVVRSIETVCLVLRTRQTSRRIAGRAIHTLRKAGAPPRWLVFNRVGVATVIRYHRCR